MDLSYLNESLSGDSEMLRQMIQLFLDQSPKKIALLKKNVIKKDFNAIRETSHFLKSSFSIMGLESKKELSKIEQLSTQQEDYDTITILTEKVLNNFDESAAEYKKIMSSL
ncbi:Hpt domain-containing protein [Polaribacter huanghezhanensis]|uniref:Hpt domain-containing protein n=1 Tax=Polaribacter huanghezhanensis TaxID=1354726 RepID=UPI002647C0EB|nr:Hpt domain-containing protein [Polaribacter huanghezhanensis]